MTEQAAKPLTDGEHYRAIRAAMKAFRDAVEAAKGAGLELWVEITHHSNDDGWTDYSCTVERHIGEGDA
jgi:hypothetical protein